MNNKNMEFSKKHREWAKLYKIDLPLMIEKFLDEEMEYYRNHVRPQHIVRYGMIKMNEDKFIKEPETLVELMEDLTKEIRGKNNFLKDGYDE